MKKNKIIVGTLLAIGLVIGGAVNEPVVNAARTDMVDMSVH